MPPVGGSSETRKEAGGERREEDLAKVSNFHKG